MTALWKLASNMHLTLKVPITTAAFINMFSLLQRKYVFLLLSVTALWKLASNMHLTLKVPITTAADDIHKYFFIASEKIRFLIAVDDCPVEISF